MLRFEWPGGLRQVHQCQLPIRWGDLDAMGHVNNTVYFRYMESLRVEWFERIGAPLDPQGVGPVIINAYCNFLTQLEYPGTVLATQYVGAVGRSSFDTYATLERTDRPGVVYAEGGAKVVWTDLQAQQSRPLPEGLRALLAGS